MIIQDQPQGCILPYFYRLPRELSLSITFVEFSLKPAYSTAVGLGKIFSFTVFRLLQNVLVNQKIESRHFFTHFPSKTLHQVLTITHHTERIYSSPQAKFFRKFLFPRQKGAKETMNAIKFQQFHIVNKFYINISLVFRGNVHFHTAVYLSLFWFDRHELTCQIKSHTIAMRLKSISCNSSQVVLL